MPCSKTPKRQPLGPLHNRAKSQQEISLVAALDPSFGFSATVDTARHIDTIGRSEQSQSSESALSAVLLDTRRTQPRQAVLINGTLPSEEFLDRQSVPGTGLFEGKQAAAHGGDNLRLAADDPSLGAWGR
jgi:hypothetical protein